MGSIRIELLVGAALVGLLAISALAVSNHLAAADPGEGCWSAQWHTDGPSPACAAAIRAFGTVTSAADDVRALAAFLPLAVGSLLGVGLGHLTALLYALPEQSRDTKRRGHRACLILVSGVSIVALLVAGLVVRHMADAAEPWSYIGPGRIPSLAVLGTEGAPFVGRGVLALGMGLLAGAALVDRGRALAAAGTVTLSFVLLGSPVLHSATADVVGVWRVVSAKDAGEGLLTELRYVAAGYREADGPVLDQSALVALFDERCPRCDPSQMTQWLDENLTRVAKVAPLETYPTFEAVDTSANVGIGLGGAIAALVLAPRQGRARVKSR